MRSWSNSPPTWPAGPHLPWNSAHCSPRTQSINHVRLDRGRTADLRDGNLLDLAEGPFGSLARVAEVARVSSARRAGRFDIPNLGLFIWRLGCYSITRAAAYCWDQARNQYSFSILGNDTPLMTLPAELGRLTEPAETDVPAWIRRRPFEANLADYYGSSLCIWRDTLDGPPVPVTDVVAADLTGWTYRPRRGQVAVDPVLGRIAFPPGSAPTEGVWVSYHYGFSADMGGRRVPAGPSRDRRPPGLPGGVRRARRDHHAALSRWRDEKAGPTRRSRTRSSRSSTAGRLPGKHRYPPGRGDHLELRAAPGTRPVIMLLDWYANRPDAMRVYGTGQANGTSASGPLPSDTSRRCRRCPTRLGAWSTPTLRCPPSCLTASW